jgi:hypothetical protein
MDILMSNTTVRDAIGEYDGAAITLQNRAARVTITCMWHRKGLMYTLSGDIAGATAKRFDDPVMALTAALAALAKYMES